MPRLSMLLWIKRLARRVVRRYDRWRLGPNAMTTRDFVTMLKLIGFKESIKPPSTLRLYHAELGLQFLLDPDRLDEYPKIAVNDGPMQPPHDALQTIHKLLEALGDDNGS